MSDKITFKVTMSKENYELFDTWCETLSKTNKIIHETLKAKERGEIKGYPPINKVTEPTVFDN